MEVGYDYLYDYLHEWKRERTDKVDRNHRHGTGKQIALSTYGQNL